MFTKNYIFALALGLGVHADAAQRISVEWVIDGKAEVREVVFDDARTPVTIDTRKQITLAPTSGDCSNLDTSAIPTRSESGVFIRLIPIFVDTDDFRIATSFKYAKLLGTSPFEFRPGCVINNKREEGFAADSTVTLHKTGVVRALVSVSSSHAPTGESAASKEIVVWLRWLQTLP